MAVQLDGKATERQRKYLGVLSSQGKEKFGQDFSIRKMAEEQAIDWENMSMEEANKLIKEVKEMIESQAEVNFQISEQDLMKRIAEKKEEKPEQEHTQAPASTSTTHTYMIQLVIPEDKLTALTVVLEAMRLGYIVLQEVRA